MIQPTIYSAKPRRTGAWIRQCYWSDKRQRSITGPWFYTARPDRYASRTDYEFLQYPAHIAGDEE